MLLFKAKSVSPHIWSRIGVLTMVFTAVAVTLMAYARGKLAAHSQQTFAAPRKIPNDSLRRSTSSMLEGDSLDQLSVPVSVADPLVLRAGEAVRNAFNTQRRAYCSSIGTYNKSGAIQYAKKAVETNGTVMYTLEIVLGNTVIYARVALQPSTKNATAYFQLLFSIPGPCESEAPDQLAVSALVVKKINKQNLSWTAALDVANEGVRVKQFGLGHISMSDEDRQAYLVRLMSSQTSSSTVAVRAVEQQESGAQRRAAATFHADAMSPIQASLEPSTIASPATTRVSVSADLLHMTESAPEFQDTETLTPVPRHPPGPAGRQRAVRSLTQPTNFTPPIAFDTRDIYAGQVPCKAFTVLNQGGCGSCYAFSTAVALSARFCRANRSTSVGNVVISPQELMDCTSGCGGGDVLSTIASTVSRPIVEQWCDPYTGVQQACGSVCSTSNTYGSQAGSVRRIGGAGAFGVLQMQLELIRGGPGVVSLMVFNDLFAYSAGVYTPSATATAVGGHAVSLVGWGTDKGVPYWLCQNSWGAGWGEAGFFRIARGLDSCGIESSSGLVVAKPLVRDVCPASDCSYTSATRKDCSCQCPYGRAGSKCRDCTLNCRNGGVRMDFCTWCACRMGYFGKQCEGGYRLGPLVSCANDPTAVISASYNFTSSDVLQPTQTSFVGIYPLSETGPFKYVASTSICGTTYNKYNASVNGGLCPSSGTFRLAKPTAPGQYKIVVVPWSPMNELGLQGYYPLKDTDIVGLYSVLPANCSSASRSAALLANDPATLLTKRLAAAATAQSAALATMKVRLDAAQPLLQALLAETPASLTITSLSASKPLVWMGIPGIICYSIPPSANVNPKGLVLYVGSGATGSYYVNALGGGNIPMPVGPLACSNFTLSKGVAVGLYTIALEDSATGSPFAAISFSADIASLSYTTYTLSATSITPTVAWSISANRASVTDKVRVYNSQGAVVYWFYTSCKCQTTPGAIAAPTGAFAYTLLKAGAVAGGYTVKLHPGGLSAVAAVARDWIPWAKIGW